MLSKTEQDSIDLVFIDGRFRVACCLKCYDIINDNCLIGFDDFLMCLIVCLIVDQNLSTLCCLLSHMSRLRSIIGTFYTTDSIFNLIKK